MRDGLRTLAVDNYRGALERQFVQPLYNQQRRSRLLGPGSARLRVVQGLRVVAARGCLSGRARRWPNMPAHHYHPVSMVPIASKRRDIPFAHDVNADIYVVVTAF
jgi:hypothetical protein